MKITRRPLNEDDDANIFIKRLMSYCNSEFSEREVYMKSIEFNENQ